MKTTPGDVLWSVSGGLPVFDHVLYERLQGLGIQGVSIRQHISRLSLIPDGCLHGTRPCAVNPDMKVSWLFEEGLRVT